jgi:hypothetical protein
MKPKTTAGRCLCGKTRYSLAAATDDVAWCHCTLCRRASGSAAVPWMTVRLADFTWIGEPPGEIAMTEHGVRYFCRACGTHLALFTTLTPESIDVTVGSLDAPEDHPPTRHIWVSARLPWWPDDALPKEEGETYDPPGSQAPGS